MNRYLRFPVGSAALLAGVLLASCSSAPPRAEIPPLAALPGHEITYEVHIFDLPSDQPFQGPTREVLSLENGERLMARQAGKTTLAKRTAGRLGQNRILGSQHEFVYPTEWTPPKLAPKGSSGFPVTPATPAAFETTSLGTTLELVGRRALPGWVDLDMKINRKVLLGFQNYGKPIMTEGTDFRGKKVPIVITENRIEKPVFSSHRSATSARLSPDQFIVIRGESFRPPADLKPPLEVGKAGRSPDFIAFIRIALPE